MSWAILRCRCDGVLRRCAVPSGETGCWPCSRGRALQANHLGRTGISTGGESLTSETCSIIVSEIACLQQLSRLGIQFHVQFWREKDIRTVPQPYPLQYSNVRKQGSALSRQLQTEGRTDHARLHKGRTHHYSAQFHEPDFSRGLHPSLPLSTTLLA